MSLLAKIIGTFSNDDGDSNENVKKKNWTTGLLEQNNKFAGQVHKLLCTFLCRHCTTATWKCLILRFMENFSCWKTLNILLQEQRDYLSLERVKPVLAFPHKIALNALSFSSLFMSLYTLPAVSKFFKMLQFSHDFLGKVILLLKDFKRLFSFLTNFDGKKTG